MEIWSFFSGAMGLDLGLHQAGLKTTLAVEIDRWCCETIRGNLPSLDLIEGDVRKLTGANLRAHRHFNGEVFLMVGGPPCQSFSPGGKRSGLSDSRGNLIYEYFRLIAEIQPKYFIFENVAHITTAALRHRKIEDRPGQHWSLKRYSERSAPSQEGVAPLDPDELSGSALRQLLTDITSLNYTVSFGILDAAEYGVPQHRLRFVMLGSKLSPPPTLPIATHGKPDSGTLPFVTLRECIYDLIDEPGLHSSYTKQMAYYFSFIPEGGSWRSLPEDLQREAMGASYYSGGGKTGFFRRLRWNAPAPTITGRANRKGSAVCHPTITRPLSVKECARIQTFPDDWEFYGPMNQQYLQIGNAVPVGLGRAIATSIIEQETENTTNSGQAKETLSLDVMLNKATARLQASARNKVSEKSVNQMSFDW